MTREDKKYSIIYADPPWAYNHKGTKNKKRGHADQHYGVMTDAEISALPVKNIKTDDAFCFIWATFPRIHSAIHVMEVWGFKYTTAAFVWVKKNKKNNTNFWGMGKYTRANAEVCLLGISEKTKCMSQIKNHGIHQIIEAPIEEHSKKPDIVREKIIQLLGDLPKVELFARQKTEGWDVWGNEVEKDIEL